PLYPLFVGGSLIQRIDGPALFHAAADALARSDRSLAITTAGAPNFAYDLCCDRITPAQREQLDLSSWTLAFCGAEPIRRATLERFAATFAPCGFRREAFYPCYGLAEATLLVTGGCALQAPSVRTFRASALEVGHVVTVSSTSEGMQALVGCGQPSPDQQVMIV